MQSIFSIHYKSTLTRNRNLIDLGYYDRKILFNLLSQLRIRNYKNCVLWEIVEIDLLYRRGQLLSYFHRGTYNGIMSTMRTFVNYTEKYKENKYHSMQLFLTGDHCHRLS